MSIEIKVPVLPESVADATIATWYKKPGDFVKRDERLVDVETDKIVLEVVAPADGVLESCLKNQGDRVKNQEIIGTFRAGVGLSETTPIAEPIIESVLSPSMRRRVAEQDLNVGEAVPVIHGVRGVRGERRVLMTRLRARIAERLLQAQQTAAILTTFNEINMQPVMQLRQKYKETFEKNYGVRLGFMSFFVTAVIDALKHFPIVNAAIEGDDIVYHDYYDIGVAVSSPRGLVVPVIRNAEQLSMAEIEKTIANFGEKAKNGQLSLEDITGGTFTISNGGVFGSLLSTPILNPPQSAILGMHKIQERPVVENGVIIVRPMMYVALSYDHRIIDGADSVRFLVAIKELLEDPARFLLHV